MGSFAEGKVYWFIPNDSDVGGAIRVFDITTIAAQGKSGKFKKFKAFSAEFLSFSGNALKLFPSVVSHSVPYTQIARLVWEDSKHIVNANAKGLGGYKHSTYRVRRLAVNVRKELRALARAEATLNAADRPQDDQFTRECHNKIAQAKQRVRDWKVALASACKRFDPKFSQEPACLTGRDYYLT